MIELIFCCKSRHNKALSGCKYSKNYIIQQEKTEKNTLFQCIFGLKLTLFQYHLAAAAFGGGVFADADAEFVVGCLLAIE